MLDVNKKKYYFYFIKMFKIIPLKVPIDKGLNINTKIYFTNTYF